MPERPLALFYAGPNGSGKSTLRELDDDSRIQTHIDPDAIARAMNAGDAQAADLSAGREALRRFKAALVAKTSFSMETTLSGASILKRMADARAAGFEVALRYVALDDPDENVARVADRVARGGHHIPEVVIRRRYTESLENLPRAIVLCDKAIIRDNSGTHAVTHLVIENNTIERRTEAPPQWIVTVEARIAQALITRPD